MSTTVQTPTLEKFLSSLGKPANPKQLLPFERLKELSFPTTRNEYWKYTRLGKISNGTFSLPNVATKKLNVDNFLVSDRALIFENGLFHSDIIEGGSDYSIEFLNPGFEGTVPFDDKELFTVLNRAYLDRILWIHIADQAKPKNPIHVINVSHGSGILASPAVYITTGNGAKANVVLSLVGENDSANLTNSVVQAHVGEGSDLEIDVIQNEGGNGLHISNTTVLQEKNSIFRSRVFTLSGSLVRNNVNVQVTGENCETHLHGLVAGQGKFHADNHTFVDHHVANCFSNENYKYVLNNQSTGVFNGKVVVRKDAQHINAYQKNANILLSEQASVYSKPELEIYADDVKCTHGSTTGQLDENAIFYLQARGISKSCAERMLVGAFVSEHIHSIDNDRLRKSVQKNLADLHGISVEIES